MIRLKSKKFTLVLLVLICLLDIINPEVIKGQGLSDNWVVAIWQRLTSRPTRDQRPSSIHRGGGNRDICPFSQEDLIAIVPITPKDISYIEKTISEHPTFRFYLPYEANSGLQAEFILKDINEQLVYQTTFSLKFTPGLVSITPSKESDLKVGQKYRWVFSVICNPDNRSADNTVNGWIQIINPSNVFLDIDLAKLSNKERFKLYTNELLWFDMLDSLIELQIAYPEVNEYKTTWKLLLKQVGLSDDAISQAVKSP